MKRVNLLNNIDFGQGLVFALFADRSWDQQAVRVNKYRDDYTTTLKNIKYRDLSGAAIA